MLDADDAVATPPTPLSLRVQGQWASTAEFEWEDETDGDALVVLAGSHSTVAVLDPVDREARLQQVRDLASTAAGLGRLRLSYTARCQRVDLPT